MVRSDTDPLASPPIFYAIIDADPYLLPVIHSALSTHFPRNTYNLITDPTNLPTTTAPLLQITPYETLSFPHLLSHPTTSLANSYIIRKALIRKHYLHNTIQTWLSKHPDDRNLKEHVPLTVAFEVDYAEFLDEALAECWELHESFARQEREWWVLKPGMSDQGQGVRLFTSEEELRGIFEEWEEGGSDEEEVGIDTPPSINGQDVIGAGTVTSQLRHFVAQRYIHPPLLLEAHGNRKFHFRSYVLAVGALRVYAYRQMLALFAPSPYVAPGDESEGDSTSGLARGIESSVHLTNTCRQDGSREGSVIRFMDLQQDPTKCPRSWKAEVYNQICASTGILFEAAAREQMIHFQTLENAFEIFGVDWVVDDKGVAWLLEVNAFPDFKQTGDDLKDVVQGLWDGVIGIAVKGFFDPGDKEAAGFEEDRYGMRKVLDVDLGRR